MAGGANTSLLKAFSIVVLFLAALLSVIASGASAQQIAEAPAAAPQLDTGSACACGGASGAIFWSSLIIAALAVLKH